MAEEADVGSGRRNRVGKIGKRGRDGERMEECRREKGNTAGVIQLR